MGPTKEPPAKGGSKLGIKFDLGNIEVKGQMLDVALSGVKGAPLQIQVADQARISGDIQFTRGKLEVFKKQFEIEQGLVHMRPEDPGNPYINVTARWNSPDGVIYVEYVGVLLPIDKSKIKLRAVPAKTEDEIMAALLFGGQSQQTVAGAQSTFGQQLAGSILAQQFSTQLSSNISTNVGTSEDGSLKPGLVYTSGNKVIELSTYGASGAPGQTGTTGGTAARAGQHTQVSVDWRFWRNWSLRGFVDVSGDQTSSGVDILWQYRY
jgi:translocation and assembly module TamB